jgi:K+ transporter
MAIRQSTTSLWDHRHSGGAKWQALWGIARHPGVLLGLDPRYAISYLAHDGFKAFAVLGGVFLCVTGAEGALRERGCGDYGRWIG